MEEDKIISEEPQLITKEQSQDISMTEQTAEEGNQDASNEMQIEQQESQLDAEISNQDLNKQSESNLEKFPSDLDIITSSLEYPEDQPEEITVSIKKVLTLPHDIESNIEYLANKQSRKESLEKLHEKYLESHPEIKSFLSDFLQFLLQKKPENVYDFTRDYFSAFSA